MTTGLFRDGEFVHASYDGKSVFPIARRLYELNGYLPLAESLPTAEEYRLKNG